MQQDWCTGGRWCKNVIATPAAAVWSSSGVKQQHQQQLKHPSLQAEWLSSTSHAMTPLSKELQVEVSQHTSCPAHECVIKW
jgi:hypothetical protein